MTEPIVVVLIVALVLLIVLIRRRSPYRPVQWSDSLRRLHAGVSQKAEWMASNDVLQAVEDDYLAAQQWMAESLLAGYLRFLREAPTYLTGSYLAEQQKLIQLQLRKRGPRLTGIIRAHHCVRVRHFSDDGLSCYVVDHQTERRMATYDYWQRRRVHTQDLGEGAYVYHMVYDRVARRWKINEFVQQLPSGWGHLGTANTPIRLEESLPIASGRDI